MTTRQERDGHERLREILPIPDPPTPPVRTFDARDPETSFPVIEPLRPPAGAPNIVICMLDDVGFGAPSAFGGPCATPTAERLAENGLKYTRFHTTALCSPTRAALLTGRNHHSVGMGGVTDIATSSPGYTSVRPKNKATIAEILKLNGYSTAQIGKCHEVPTWQSNPFGPFDQWPIGNGFEYFYGFIGGETNQWYPALYEGTAPVQPERTPEEGYHFMDDMTTKAIRWVQQQHALMPDKPFFLYFAPGLRMRRTMCHANGPTSTAGNSTRAGTACARRRSSARRNLASSPRTPGLRPAPRASPRGTKCRPN